MAVLSPTTGDFWDRGANETITWATDPLFITGVRIELLKAGVVDTLIAEQVPDNGSYVYAVPAGQTQDNDYRIRLSVPISGGGGASIQGGLFTIGSLVIRTLSDSIAVFDGDPDSGGGEGIAGHEIKTITRTLLETIELTDEIFDLFDGNTFVYHINGDAWTKFVGLDLQEARILSGGLSAENVVLLLDANGEIFKYPGTDYTSTSAQIRSRSIYMDKGDLQRMKVEYGGAVEPTLSCMVKNEDYPGGEKETVADQVNSDVYVNIVEGGTRGKSFLLRVQNARIIHSLSFIWRKIGG